MIPGVWCDVWFVVCGMCPDHFYLQVIGFGSVTNSSPLGLTMTASSKPSLASKSEPESEEMHRDSLLRMVDSRDLMDFGMIPEFVGRFPVVVTLTSLDTPALVDILTKPKNALVSQYTHLFEMDQVTVERHTYTSSLVCTVHLLFLCAPGEAGFHSRGVAGHCTLCNREAHRSQRT